MMWAWVKFERLPQIWDFVDMGTVPVAQTLSKNMFACAPGLQVLTDNHIEIAENRRFRESEKIPAGTTFKSWVYMLTTPVQTIQVNFLLWEFVLVETLPNSPLVMHAFFQYYHVVVAYHCDFSSIQFHFTISYSISARIIYIYIYTIYTISIILWSSHFLQLPFLFFLGGTHPVL